MKLKLKEIDKKWKEYALAGCVCILFYLCVTHISAFFRALGSFFSVCAPVLFGCIIAYIFNPLAVFLSKRVFSRVKKDKLRWTMSVLVTLVIVFALLALLLSMLIPQMIDNVVSLLDNFDVYISNLRNALSSLGLPFEDLIDDFLRDFTGENGVLTKVMEIFKANLNQILAKTSDIGSAAMNWLIGAVIAVYLLMAKASILGVIRKLMMLVMKPLTSYRTGLVLGKFHSIFSRYIICEILDALIIGVVNFIFMLCTGMPDALFISVIAGLTNLAPTFGPIVGAGIGGFILLLMKPRCVIPFLIFTLIIQTVDGYLIKPKLFGGALNVPGVVILAAIIVFGRIMGVVGMLIAIPAAAIIVYIYSEVLIPWLELRKDLKAYYKEKKESGGGAPGAPDA